MFGEGELNFPFPLFTTCMHMLVQFLFASLVLFLFPRFRPRADSISNPQNHSPSSLDPTQPGKPLMTRMFYITRIGPCGAATGLDIGLGNMSLKFVTLTFYSKHGLLTISFKLIFPSDVQIFCSRFRTHLRLRVPLRVPFCQTHSHYRHHDNWRHHDGCR